jgi:hypothetical protein
VFVLGVTVVFAAWMSPHESDMAARRLGWQMVDG